MRPMPHTPERHLKAQRPKVPGGGGHACHAGRAALLQSSNSHSHNLNPKLQKLPPRLLNLIVALPSTSTSHFQFSNLSTTRKRDQRLSQWPTTTEEAADVVVEAEAGFEDVVVVAAAEATAADEAGTEVVGTDITKAAASAVRGPRRRISWICQSIRTRRSVLSSQGAVKVR